MKKKNSGNLFNVANILDKKVINGKPYYYIEWEGYPLEDATWEPLKHLENCLDIVEKFERKLERKTKKNSQKIELNSEKKAEKLITKDLDEKKKNSSLLKNSKKITFTKNFFKHGRFEEGDKPKRILFSKRDVNKKLLCAIEWNDRVDGSTLHPTFYSNDEIKKFNPGILVDFYEKNIRFLE